MGFSRPQGDTPSFAAAQGRCDAGRDRFRGEIVYRKKRHAVTLDADGGIFAYRERNGFPARRRNRPNLRDKSFEKITVTLDPRRVFPVDMVRGVLTETTRKDAVEQAGLEVTRHVLMREFVEIGVHQEQIGLFRGEGAP